MARVMLQQKKIVGDTELKSKLSQSHNVSDLTQLRQLLLGSEFDALIELQREFSDHSHTSQKISEVISEAIALRAKQDNSLTHALAPSIEEAIHVSVKRDPKRLANALFPVIGPAIRESVAEMFNSMMQQVNQLLENSLSVRSIKWRINAFRTNRSFAEVMLSETVLYQVEQVFMIHRESSLLINHLSSERAIVKDPDMVSGMLTAVTDFVKDSFVVDKQQNIKSIKFGQLNLLIEVGPYAILVAAVRGITPPDLQITMREQLEELHRLYGMQLEAYDGDSQHFPDTYTQLRRCLVSKDKQDSLSIDNKKPIPWAAIAALILFLGLPVAWFINHKLEQSRWNNIVQELQAEPGLVILNHTKQDGAYQVKGLRDPLSREPEQISSALSDFNRAIAWQWQSYYSSEAQIVKQRIKTMIDPPQTVITEYVDGKLILSGEAEPSWIKALSTKLPLIWGVQEVDQTNLRSSRSIEQEMQQLIGSIEAVVLEFAPFVNKVESNQYGKLSEVSNWIKSLLTLAKRQNVKLQIGILGFADGTGRRSANYRLSELRARNVQDALMQYGLAKETMIAKGLGVYSKQTEFTKVIPCTSQRCVVFEVYPNYR